MEIERYTLATGETALTGFNRFWKHWGLVLRRHGVLREPVARLGHQRRRRSRTYMVGGNATLHRHRHAGRDRGGADAGAGRLRRRSSGLIFVKVAASASCSRWRWCSSSRAVGVGALPAGLLGVGQAPDSTLAVRARARRGSSSPARAGGRTSPEQLDPRQGLRHGHLHPADRVPDHGRRSGGAGDRLDDATGRRKYPTVPRLVDRRQQGAARFLLVHLHLLHHGVLDTRVLHGRSDRTSPARRTWPSSRPKARHSRRSSRPGSAPSSGSSDPSP